MGEVLLEAVSPFGVKLAGSEKWTNFDKSAGLKKEDYHAGDAVELTLNKSGFITAIAVKTAAPPKKAWTPKSSGYVESPEKSAKMARGAAIKAVMESQFVFEQVKDLAESEGLKHILAISEEVANYIEKGL